MFNDWSTVIGTLKSGAHNKWAKPKPLANFTSVIDPDLEILSFSIYSMKFFVLPHFPYKVNVSNLFLAKLGYPQRFFD